MSLTRIEGVPTRAEVKPGMAHFAYTGPAGKTCGDCAACQIQAGRRELYRCATFKRLTGKIGNCIMKQFGACKYFEQKQQR
jgi:hypothetical protein